MAGGGAAINSVTFNPLKTTFTVNPSRYEDAGSITISCSGAPDSGVYVESISSSDTSIAEATLNQLSGTVSGNNVTTDFMVKPNSAGTVTLTATAFDNVNLRNVTGTLKITVTPTEDESYLNERGLAHFWENIDTLKQDKLTAGTNIAISANNTISAETGWKYLGQVKLASAGASLTFNLPAQYDNYKIIAAGEMASGSNATCQLQLLRSGSAIPSAWGVLDINGSNIVAGTRTAADDQFSMTTCNQYDTINMEMTSFKTASTQWRKYQGYQARMGSAYVTRQYNGRFNSSTEPNQVRIWTNATFGAGTVIKVWASNNT